MNEREGPRMDDVDGGCLGKMNETVHNNIHPEKKSLVGCDAGAIQSCIENVSNNNDEERIIETQESTVAPIISSKLSYYKMGHDSRGLLIIFNHETFQAQIELPPRPGTDKDVEKITKAFKTIGFEVHPYKDLTLSEIQKKIKSYVETDYYHYRRDCLAIFILTHGNEKFMWAKDAEYDPAREIWGKFTGDKCPAFAGKPKLMFFQACQGSKLDPGVMMALTKPVPKGRTEFDGEFGHVIPTCADFLICYPTFAGYYAFRNEERGSFWVTVLCEEFEKHHKTMNLLDILTIVNNRMAIEFSSYNTRNPARHDKRQVSYFSSSLTRRLVFGDKANNNVFPSNELPPAE